MVVWRLWTASKTAPVGSSAPRISALDHPLGTDDHLPAGLAIWPESDIPSSSVRLFVEHDGIRYFGAKSADGRRACVAALPKERETTWIGGCSDLRDDREVVHVSGTGVAGTVLVSDGYDVDSLIADGWMSIHRNIVIATR